MQTPTRWLRHAPVLLSSVLFLGVFACVAIAVVKLSQVVRHGDNLHAGDFIEVIQFGGYALLLSIAEAAVDIAIARRRRARLFPAGLPFGPARVGTGRRGYLTRAGVGSDWVEVTASELKVGDQIQFGRFWQVVSAKGHGPDDPALAAIWVGTVDPIVCAGDTVFMAITAASRKAAVKRWAAGTDRLFAPNTVQ